MKKTILSALVICLLFSITGCTSTNSSTDKNQIQWDASKFYGNILEAGISNNIQSLAIYTKSKYIAIDNQSDDGQAVLTQVNNILTDKSSFDGVTNGAFLIPDVGKPLDYLNYETSYLVIFLKANQEYNLTVNEPDGQRHVMTLDVYAMSFDLSSSEVCFLDTDYAIDGYCFLKSFGLSSSSSAQELSVLIKDIQSR